MKWMGVLLAGAMLPAAPAYADGDPTKLVVAGGVSVSKSDWRRDAGAQTSLELGLQTTRWLSFHFLGRLGYGTIDERLMTYVSIGAKAGFDVAPGVWTYGRLSLSHQHEETLLVVEEDPVGALFGIGDGIRHRGGGEVGVGAMFDLVRVDDTEVFVSAEVSAVIFPDSRGPHIYAGLSTALGLRYAL